MISCKLQGGMANSIFQCAAIYSLALKNNVECGFNLNSHVPLQGHQAIKYADNIFKKVPRLPENEVFPYSYREPEFTYKELPFQDGCLYEGYFQSPKYWAGYEEQVKDLFDVPPITEFDCSELTAVHVRRGDFLKHSYIYNILPKEYYELVMWMLGGKFIFVSDDMPWVQENFKGDNILYSPFDNEIDDFRLIASTKHVVAANSTFSLMAGILNPSKGIRVCPGGLTYPWFASKNLDSRDMTPTNWIKT